MKIKTEVTTCYECGEKMLWDGCCSNLFCPIVEPWNE